VKRYAAAPGATPVSRMGLANMRLKLSARGGRRPQFRPDPLGGDQTGDIRDCTVADSHEEG